jgi:hypothetical protein
VEHGNRSDARASTTRRALSLALLAVQLVVFTLGAALAGQSQPVRASGSALVVATASSSDGSVRAAASQDSRIEHAARARGDRGDRTGGAPPLDLAFLLDVPAVGPACLDASLDWRSSVREHRPPPSVVHGARGPPQT